MITSPSLMAPWMDELACTSQGFTPLVALTRKAWPPGMPSTAKYFALGLSGWKFQVPFESLLMVLVQMSSWAMATEPSANPASRQVQNFMRQPPGAHIHAMKFLLVLVPSGANFSDTSRKSPECAARPAWRRLRCNARRWRHCGSRVGYPDTY